MSLCHKIWTTAVLVSVLGGFLSLPASADEVLPGQGVTFNQVDFTFDLAPLANSDTAEVSIQLAELRLSSGLSEGFLNVETSLGWSVQNLPVFADFPYPNISTNFDLGNTPGVDVTSIDVYVDFSPSPSVSFTGGDFRPFPVGNIEFNAEGEGGEVLLDSRPDPPATVTFEVTGLLEAKFQPNHPHIQTAHRQCLPAAVATSFQWLENTYGLDVPHPIGPGLGVDANADGQADDGTLVGQLDIEMERNSINRESGFSTGTEDGLRGKLRYIGKNGLADDLWIKHMGSLGAGNVSEVVVGSNGIPRTVSSIGLGPVVTADRLIQEICDGEDVELGFLYEGGGGHRVEVVGAGKILGIPFVIHQSDYKQSNRDNLGPPAGDGIDDNEGTDRLDFNYLIDTDMDGKLNLVYNKKKATIHSFFSQSPVETLFKDGFESGDTSAWSSYPY